MRVYLDDDHCLSQILASSLLILQIAFHSSTFITSCTIANFMRYCIQSKSRVFHVVLNFQRLFLILTFEKSFLSYQSKCNALSRGMNALKSLISSISYFELKNALYVSFVSGVSGFSSSPYSCFDVCLNKLSQASIIYLKI